MPAPAENQNAAKDEANVASSFLHVRVVPREKAAWVKAAKRRKKKLAEWTTETLNHAALVPQNE
jgi:predicted HicB family RNase H-like nuclease